MTKRDADMPWGKLTAGKCHPTKACAEGPCGSKRASLLKRAGRLLDAVRRKAPPDECDLPCSGECVTAQKTQCKKKTVISPKKRGSQRAGA